MSYKICPVCDEKNSIDEIICKKCLSDISNVQPYSEEEENSNKLVLKNDEITLTIKSNETIGREHKEAKYFKKYPTVSRKHCQFIHENGKWFVKDLGSTNKTYIDKKPIEPMKNVELHNGKELWLSKSLHFKVEM